MKKRTNNVKVDQGQPPLLQNKPRAPSGGGLTQAISREVKMRGSRNILTGTVMMSTKGKASEACVDMTAHSAARHTSWMQVNRCIRSVRTCSDNTRVRIHR